jgi:hypothetical protein
MNNMFRSSPNHEFLLCEGSRDEQQILFEYAGILGPRQASANGFHGFNRSVQYKVVLRVGITVDNRGANGKKVVQEAVALHRSGFKKLG